MLFERFAIEVLQMTQSVQGAMAILRLKWDATWHLIERAVARGKARKELSPLPRRNQSVPSIYCFDSKRVTESVLSSSLLMGGRKAA